MSTSISSASRPLLPGGKKPQTVVSSIAAKTLTMPLLLIGSYDPTGTLIDTKTALDPRESYCNDYNAFSGELGTGVVARPIPLTG
jgi:hypothetical protein